MSNSSFSSTRPSDKELLRLIYRRLDWAGVAEDSPGLSMDRIQDLFNRLEALLPEDTARRPDHRTASQRASCVEASNALILHVDGGSRGNPGPAGCGAVLLDPSGQVVDEKSRFIGRATSNEAEYHALIMGLKAASARGANEITIRADSQLMVRQINGDYKVKSPNLQPLFSEVKNLLSKFSAWRAEHVRREQNARADALANRAMDDGQRNTG